MESAHVSTIHAANARLISDGEVDAVGEFFSSGFVAHLTGQEIRGHAAIRGFLKMLLGAFPDLQLDIEILVEDGDRVSWQRTYRGTHEGDYAGVPGSGRQLVWRDMLVSRFEDGLIAEEWVISDLAEHMFAASARPAGEP